MAHIKLHHAAVSIEDAVYRLCSFVSAKCTARRVVGPRNDGYFGETRSVRKGSAEMANHGKLRCVTDVQRLAASTEENRNDRAKKTKKTSQSFELPLSVLFSAAFAYFAVGGGGIHLFSRPNSFALGRAFTRCDELPSFLSFNV